MTLVTINPGHLELYSPCPNGYFHNITPKTVTATVALISFIIFTILFTVYHIQSCTKGFIKSLRSAYFIYPLNRFPSKAANIFFCYLTSFIVPLITMTSIYYAYNSMPRLIYFCPKY